MISIDDEMSEVTSEQIAFLKARCNDEDGLKMNLIEQLGGYESAFNFHTERVNSHKTFIYDGLGEELLNYRKKHNIFEEGDLVVHPKYHWLILRVHDPIPSEDLLFAHTNDHVLFHWGKGLVFDKKGVVAVSYSECKHASYEEIELGRMK